MKVVAVIGDVVASRGIAARAQFQRKLGKILRARTKAATGLASPYTLTLGDEFQAVYRSADSLWVDLIELLAAIHPVRARLAIGVGELSTRINPEQALGMDGPAFHHARAAMTALKENGGRLLLRADAEEPWHLANHSLTLIAHYLDGWAATRLRVLAALLRGESVRDMESALKISKVAVYKNINVAALDAVVGICQEISRAINAELRTA
jgi:hypothetical protein